MITTVFVLLVVFQLKHWLADYPLQRPWMLGKFKPGFGFVLPLAAHCVVHAVFTFLIVFAVRHDLHLGYALAAFDFMMHFAMDRIKASPTMMGRWKPLTAEQYVKAKKDLNVPSTISAEARAALRGNRMFWHSIGIDQAVHHLTHYAIIWALVH